MSTETISIYGETIEPGPVQFRETRQDYGPIQLENGDVLVQWDHEIFSSEDKTRYELFRKLHDAVKGEWIGTGAYAFAIGNARALEHSFSKDDELGLAARTIREQLVIRRKLAFGKHIEILNAGIESEESPLYVLFPSYNDWWPSKVALLKGFYAVEKLVEVDFDEYVNRVIPELILGGEDKEKVAYPRERDQYNSKLLIVKPSSS